MDCHGEEGESGCSSPTVLPPTPPRSQILPEVTVIPETPPKKKPRLYKVYQVKDGWIHCRASKAKEPVKWFEGDGGRPKVIKKLTFSKEFEKNIKHLYKKDERYPCPDCEAWYGGDLKRIQFSCRHRYKSESKDSLKMWDISYFGSDDN